jgi:hypothetical protein
VSNKAMIETERAATLSHFGDKARAGATGLGSGASVIQSLKLSRRE